MARPTMATLITRLRRLISDQASSPQFVDDELQDCLDERQVTHRYERLLPQSKILPGGHRIYLEYFAESSDWEEDAELVDATYNVLTPSVSDYRVGHWTFETNTGLVVWITGKTYDLYGSAADMLERWAAKVKQEYDFASTQVRYQRSQQAKAMLDLAATYREKQLVQIADMVREDIHGAHVTGLDTLLDGRTWS